MFPTQTNLSEMLLSVVGWNSFLPKIKRGTIPLKHQHYSISSLYEATILLKMYRTSLVGAVPGFQVTGRPRALGRLEN